MCSSNNEVFDNIVSGNRRNGIFIEKSTNITILHNELSDNHFGIRLSDSSDIEIVECTLIHNWWGIDLTLSQHNRIERCTIAENEQGGIYRGRNNTIIENNFVDNCVHYYGMVGDKNFFDRNYWSGRKIPLPLPYLVNIAYYTGPPIRITLNWDMHPRVVPYDFDYST